MMTPMIVIVMKEAEDVKARKSRQEISNCMFSPLIKFSIRCLLPNESRFLEQLIVVQPTLYLADVTITPPPHTRWPPHYYQLEV